VLPVEGTFFHSVNVAHEEDSEERNHGTKYHVASGRIGQHLAVNDSPREHKNDFDIEKDEEHSDEIKLHAEAGVGLANGEHAAFVGDILGPGANPAFGGEVSGDDGKYQCSKSKGDGDAQKHQNWKVLR